MTWRSLISRISCSKPGNCNFLISNCCVDSQTCPVQPSLGKMCLNQKTCAIRQLRLAPANKKHQKTRLRIATIISSTNRKLNQREQESLYVAFQRHLKGVNYTPIKNNRMPPKKSGNMRAAASSIVFRGKKN